MTTRYDRMRAAADDIAACGTCDCDDCERARMHAATLRADADELEAVEREIRRAIDDFDGWPGQMIDWADRIRGEK